MSHDPRELPVEHPGDLPLCTKEEQWLVSDLWGRAAVGIVGGAPKCFKTWFGLDLAVSVASGTLALGRFRIDAPGAALVYLAEDALPMVRQRIEGLCRHRGLEVRGVPIGVITAPTLRLDLEGDRERLLATVDRVRPRILLLDPLVRLHRLDENSASEISGLLGFLREVQRRFDVAIVLVHHTSKKQRAQPGQALRGSSDIHAWGDSNAYLARRGGQVMLTIEHRAAKAQDPILLDLVSSKDGAEIHLDVVSAADGVAAEGQVLPSVDAAVVALLRSSEEPLPRSVLRERLKIKNERLGEVLVALEGRRAIVRVAGGYVLAADQS